MHTHKKDFGRNGKEMANCKAEPVESRQSSVKQELADLDIGFRVFKESYMEKMSTNYDYLFFCLLNLGITLDKKVEQKIVSGSEIMFYGGTELAACFSPFVDWEVVKMIIEHKPKRVVFESCSFATNEEEKRADEAIRAAVPGCEVYIVDLREIVRRGESEAWGDYRKGYFKALLDSAEWISAHQDELKYTGMNSVKGIVACLTAMAQQLPDMLKYGREAKIRVKLLNPKKVKEKYEKSQEYCKKNKSEERKHTEEWERFCDSKKTDLEG